MGNDTQNKNLLFWQYIVLPVIFLLVTLLGGLRLSLDKDAFIFLSPSLFSLILAVMLVVILIKGKLIEIGEWFSAGNPVLKNFSNVLILLTLFSASVQVINSVLPETGLAFALTAFFLLWTFWTNPFAEFQSDRLLRSLAAVFGFAFIFKYVFLASLVVTGESWAKKLMESALQGVSMGLLEIPKFSGLTGYVAFFTLVLYGVGLLLSSSISNSKSKGVSSSISSEATS
jgi:small basic protein